MAAPHNLDLTTAPSTNALVKEAGPQLMKQLRVSHPQNLTVGEIVKGRGYKANCDWVYLIALPTWTDPGTLAKRVNELYPETHTV